MRRRLGQLLTRHADAAIALAAFAIMAMALAYVQAWQALERKIFDELTVWTAPSDAAQNIVLVAVNEESMNELKLQWPWPRAVHANLVERAAQGGAVVIALDIVFSEPDRDPKNDAALAAAIAKAGNVVLAADFLYSETSGMRLWKRADPAELLMQAGPMVGMATIPFDPDQFVRRIPPEPDAFWRQIVKVWQFRVPSQRVPSLPEEDGLIRHLPDTTFRPIPYHLVLEATPEELKEAFGGRIVIVGRDLVTTPDLGLAHADMFATPFLSRSNRLTAGMKVHAAMVDNALTGTWLRAMHLPGNLAICALVALLSFLGMRRWRPLASTLVLLVLAIGVGAASGYVFAEQRLWIAVATPVAVAVLAYLAYGAVAYLAVERRKREVQRAFSRYLSPDLVQQIVVDSKKLELGGEQREITVLFTDLAGFTKLTEKHPPPVVQQVLFKHFTAMTEVIHAHKGTVVQFIGDAVMAFWGAPLGDPDHALHAVQSAIGMQRAMEALRGELRAQGLPEIHMRIGVNTCEAIVGNMGSASRLAYTAMGDGVNEASRLEGANKFWKTPILVSGATLAKLGGRVPMRRVDRIKVSGKTEATDVYTPSEDTALNARTDAAFEAYLERDWERADRLYAELLLDNEKDGVAMRLRERIAMWQREPAEASPDGSMTLDKL